MSSCNSSLATNSWRATACLNSRNPVANRRKCRTKTYTDPKLFLKESRTVCKSSTQCSQTTAKDDERRESDNPPSALRWITSLFTKSVPVEKENYATADAITAPTEVHCTVSMDDPSILRGSEPESPGLNVAVLLSGGVDSSVALRLLQRAGHRCTAFYLQIWMQEDFRNFWGECPWEEDLQFAQAVCDQAGVELRVVPLTDEYWDRVVSHTIKEIESGRTPNPDMLCNSRVKFGAFYDYLETNHGGEFDRLASGHYARIQRLPTGNGEEVQAQLCLCSDTKKDQTYFLAHLSQAQLSRVMFPIGYLPKPEVRQLAEQFQLPTCARKDSQGICFLGKVPFREFVKAHLGEREGALVEIESGLEMGRHQGFWFHTIGQRQGLGLSNGPWYVCKKDTDKNIVFISKNYHKMDNRRDRFRCAEFNWTEGTRPDISEMTQCKMRHGAFIYRCTVQEDELATEEGDDFTVTVALDGDDQGIAAGQYAVFYNDSGTCLGGGVIQCALDGTPKNAERVSIKV